MNPKEIIKKAGQNLKTIIIEYTEKDGSNEGARELEPYSFRIKNDTEFFYGFDIHKDQIRMFDLENINTIRITNNSYIPRWPVEF